MALIQLELVELLLHHQHTLGRPVLFVSPAHRQTHLAAITLHPRRVVGAQSIGPTQHVALAIQIDVPQLRTETGTTEGEIHRHVIVPTTYGEPNRVTDPSIKVVVAR